MCFSFWDNSEKPHEPKYEQWGGHTWVYSCSDSSMSLRWARADRTDLTQRFEPTLMVTLTDAMTRWVHSSVQLFVVSPPSCNTAWFKSVFPGMSKQEEHTTKGSYSTLQRKISYIRLDRNSGDSNLQDSKISVILILIHFFLRNYHFLSLKS